MKRKIFDKTRLGWRRGIAPLTVAAVLMVAPMVFEGCGRPQGSSSLGDFSYENTVFSVSGSINGYDVAVRSLVPLVQPQVLRASDCLILGWQSLAPGKATLTLGRAGTALESIPLVLAQGEGTIYTNGAPHIAIRGYISGRRTYVCGPQGARCEAALPQAKDPPIVSRGPQGGGGPSPESSGLCY